MTLDELLKEARGWLEDCGLGTRGMDDPRIARTVAWNYDGGWPAFVRADPQADEMAVYDEAERRWPQGLLKDLYPQGYAELMFKCCDEWLPYPDGINSPMCPNCGSTFHLADPTPSGDPTPMPGLPAQIG